MLLVIYNSNAQNKPDLPTIKGWRLYTSEDWSTLCVAVSNYFFYLPQDDAELCFSVEGYDSVYYYSYEEWLSDYQVSEISKHAEETLLEYNDNVELLCFLLGHTFYSPDFLPADIEEVDYPEQDAYA